MAPAGAQPPAAGPKTLKMQSSWPASSTLQDNFRYFAERVDKLTGGQLKIDALAAGQVVPAFEVLDATHKKVIDGAHSVSYYWVGKNKAATLFASTPAGPSAWTPWTSWGGSTRAAGSTCGGSSTRKNSSST